MLSDERVPNGANARIHMEHYAQRARLTVDKAWRDARSGKPWLKREVRDAE